MPDQPNPGVVSAADAEVAVAKLEAMSSDLRACAVFAGDGSPLAASGELERWEQGGRELFAAADGAAGEPVSHLHVGTEDGEVFAVRGHGLALVAVADRFALASLMFSDMRAVLRELAGAAPASTVESEAA